MRSQFERFSSFVDAWESALDEYDEVWCMGDMNLDLSKIRKDLNSDKKDFLRLIDDRIFSSGVNQVIKGNTWVRDNGLQSSCIDHIYTNKIEKIKFAEAYHAQNKHMSKMSNQKG